MGIVVIRDQAGVAVLRHGSHARVDDGSYGGGPGGDGYDPPIPQTDVDGLPAALTARPTSSQVTTLIDNAINSLLDGAPDALNTLNELAAAINDDASFAAAVTTALNARLLKGDMTFAFAPLTMTAPGVVAAFGTTVILPDASLWVGQEITILATGTAEDTGNVTINAHSGQTVNMASPSFTLNFTFGSFPNILRLKALPVPVEFGGGWTWAMVGHSGAQFLAPQLEALNTAINAQGAITTDHEARLDEMEDTGLQRDKRALGNEFLRQEWDAITHPIMGTNQSITDAGTYDATWAITRATSRGTLPHTPAGLDLQCFHLLQSPYTQHELDEAGKSLTESYQTFYEMLTLVRPTINDDWFEWARVFMDVSFTAFNSNTTGSWGHFWESTITGGANEGTRNATKDGKNTFGWPERSRLTLNCAASTITLWEWIPMDTGEDGVEMCQLGRWWRPWFVDTDPQWASMADPETELVPADHAPGFTEGDPEVIQPWRIGIQARMQFAEFYAFEYGETDPANALLAIDEAALTAAGVGESSFVDSTGVNTISSVSEALLPGPAASSGVSLPIEQSDVNGLTAALAAKVNKTESFLHYTKAQPTTEVAYSNLGTFGTASTTHGLTTVNRRSWVPIFVNADTFTRIGIYVTTMGAATTLWRLGLHADDGGWPAAALIADYGQIDVSAGGNSTRRDITINQTLETGWYWVQIQVDQHNTSPTVAAVSGLSSHPVVPLGMQTDRANPTRSRAGIYDTNGTGGALGDAPADAAATGVATTNDAVRVWIWRT